MNLSKENELLNLLAVGIGHAIGLGLRGLMVFLAGWLFHLGWNLV